MRHLLLVLLPLAPAFAKDWAGKVVDALERPIPAAQVCWQADPSVCVTGNDSGRFVLTLPDGLVGVKPSARPPGYRIGIRGGSLLLHAPRPQTARFAWFDARGRLLGRGFLLAGPGGAPLQPAPRGYGLLFLQVTGEAGALLEKVILTRDARDRPSAGAGPRALAKGAAAPLPWVLVTKPGYRKDYHPLYEYEGSTWITLRRSEDSGIGAP